MSERLSIVRRAAVVVALLASFLGATAHATILTYDIRYSSNNVYFGSGGSFTNTTTDPSGYVGDYGNDVSGPLTVIDPFYRPDRNVNTGNVGPIYYNYGQGNGYTPNVGVSYQVATSDLETNNFNPTFWPRIIRSTSNATWSTTLTPDQNFIVRVNGFALMAAATGQTHTLRWTLYKDTIGGDILASSTGAGGTQIGNLAAQNFTMSNVGPTGKVFTIEAADQIAYYVGPLLLQITYVSGTGVTQIGMDNLNFDQHTAPEPASIALLTLGAWSVLRRPRMRPA